MNMEITTLVGNNAPENVQSHFTCKLYWYRDWTPWRYIYSFSKTMIISNKYLAHVLNFRACRPQFSGSRWFNALTLRTEAACSSKNWYPLLQKPHLSRCKFYIEFESFGVEQEMRTLSFSVNAETRHNIFKRVWATRKCPRSIIMKFISEHFISKKAVLEINWAMHKEIFFKPIILKCYILHIL
jgi:hypothetical protein